MERAYDADGTRSEEWGQAHRPLVHWYPNGLLLQEETLAGGVENGPPISWRDDGTKSSRIDYRDGKETGQTAWDTTAKLIYARGTAVRDLDASESPDE